VGGAVIDLHTHTTASDGTDRPEQIIERALAAGLEALAITDHDTLLGSDEAAPIAAARGLRFVRALELSTRRADDPAIECRSVHILGYFFGEPAAAFRAWLETLRAYRRERNEGMSVKLAALGMPVAVEEAEALGRNITSRPHYARLMRDKGYVATMQEAFNIYLGETGLAYVEREDPSPEEGIRRIREAGGIASLAHAFRLNKRDAAEEERIIAGFVEAGLGAIEVWHSDHDLSSRSRYANLAKKYDLAMTGGSDYHGAHKPDVRLGRGRQSDWRVPLAVLDELHNRAIHGERRGQLR
jgi:predicted metal-dependent phosphoesterase TrpH